MSVHVEFSIWLASKTRWAHLTKAIPMPTVPRIGEFVKFRNEKMGDYFAWQVTQVTFTESGTIEVWTELLDNIDDRGYSFETEQEFDEYFQAYLSEGWQCHQGIGPNRKYKDGTGPSSTRA
jgi:hypothetical protein